MEEDTIILNKFSPHYFFDKFESNLPHDLALKIQSNIVYGIRDGNVLQYWLYYDYDGGIGPFHLGSHNTDYECLIVVLNNKLDTIERLVYRPHSSDEHFQIRTQDIHKCLNKNDGKPICYVSRGKHAQYPVDGKIFRYCATINDICIKPKEKVMKLVVYDYSDILLNKKVKRALETYMECSEVKFKDVKKRMIFNSSIPRKWISRRFRSNKS